MRIEAGQTILLGRTSYTLTEKLGSGAVADVYRATLAGVPTDVVVKVVRQDTTPDEEGQRKIEGIRREGLVLATLNQAEDPAWGNTLGIPYRVHRAQQTVSQRLVVALFDSGEMASGQPYLIQELAPPALERFEVKTLADERRALSVAHSMARAMALAHQHNLALKDFDPHTKLDRVRVRWLDEEDRFELKLIDWNVTGGPEDVPQDLLYFGGHLYYLLLGRHLVLDVAGRPPADLGGLGVPGWGRLTEGSRQILQRLLHRDPSRRYRGAAKLEADLAWWLDALRQADTPNAVDRLQDRIWQARPQERHDRVLAAADLAQQLNLTTEASRMFELWADQARQELGKETWLLVAEIRVSLLSGAYRAAVEKASTQLRQLDERTEAARMTRVLRLQAQAGYMLKEANQGADIRPTAEWAALTHAANALVQRQWNEARTAILELERLRPETANWQPVLDQLDLAQAGQLLNRAADLSTQADSRRADADRSDWAEIETGHLERLNQAVTLLQQAVELATLEPDFKDRLQAEQAHLELRRALLARYRDAEQFGEQVTPYLQRGQDAARRNDDSVAATAFTEAVRSLDNALTEYRAILEADPGQYRARRRQEQVQRQRADIQRRLDLVQARALAYTLIRRGQYSDARDPARRAANLSPDDKKIREQQTEVEVGARLEREAEARLDTALQRLEIGNLDQEPDPTGLTEDWAQQVLNMSRMSLRDLARGEALSEEVKSHLFALRADLSDRADELLERASVTSKAYEQFRVARGRGDYETAITALEWLDRQYTLSPGDREILEHVRARHSALQQAREQLDQAQAFDDLRQVLALTPTNDPSPLAAEIRRQTGETWRRMVAAESDLDNAATVLREGQRRFEGLEVAKTLGLMLELAELGGRARDQLEISATRERPIWFNTPKPELGTRLAQLDADLTKLTRSDKWPALQETARRWRNQLAGYLATHLRPRRDKAQTALMERNFDKALNEAKHAWDLVPEGLCSDLPPDVRDGLLRVIQGVQDREEAESRLEILVRGATEDNRPFIEAAESTQSISLPDGVPADDLRAVITELERGATWEQALGRVPDADTYAEVIRERQALAGQAISPLDEKWMELSNPLERLRQRLKDSIGAVSDHLPQVLQQEAKTLTDHPERSSERLLKLYWQARWLAVTRGGDERTIWEDLQPTVKSLADQALEAFGTMHHPEDLKHAKGILGTLKALNDGLASIVVNSNPLLELPLLPQGAKYESLPKSLAPQAIERLRHGVDEFSKLAKRKDPAAVEAVATQSRRLQRLLKEMAQARTVLGYEGWPGDRPVALARELERQAILAVALQEAAAHRADGEAMRGLSHLRTIARLPDLLKASWLWLLEPEQRGLKDNYAALYRGLQTDLQKQVGAILTSHATAVERLRAEIMEVARDTFTRQAAYDAIVAEVHARADEAHQHGNRGEADTLWQIVEEAVEPWVDPAVLPRHRGRRGGLRRPSSRGESNHQMQKVLRPPRRDSMTGRREIGGRVSQSSGSDAQATPSARQPQEEKKR